MLKIALCSAALTVFAMSATAATTVDIDFTTSYSGSSGSFAGTDANDDGVIEEDEVTSFYTNLLGDTSTLQTFGDYDIATNTWSEVGGYNYTATSDGTLLGASDAVTTVVAVPEPEILSMFALGAAALGLMARRRRVR